jgi:hypothetical protein
VSKKNLLSTTDEFDVCLNNISSHSGIHIVKINRGWQILYAVLWRGGGCFASWATVGVRVRRLDNLLAKPDIVRIVEELDLFLLSYPGFLMVEMVRVVHIYG